MTQRRRLSFLLAGLAGLWSLAAAADPVDRELHVRVDVEASRSWESRTEEYGHEHSQGQTTQHYELRVRLRSDTGLHTRNILALDREERLEAKTIHLARQAKKEIEASGGKLTIPETPADRAQLTRRMQQAQFECGGDSQCRETVMDRYAAIFAALDHPEALDESRDSGERRYRYFEPYQGCSHRAHVTMTLSMEGVRYDEGADALVPFTEKRSADTVNPAHDVPLCHRYRAVVDTTAENKALYVENFFVPSATGETARTVDGNTTRTTETQPMPSEVLGWITQQLRHAGTSGTASGTLRLSSPLNGITEERGTAEGSAEVALAWHFGEPGASAPPLE